MLKALISGYFEAGNFVQMLLDLNSGGNESLELKHNAVWV